MKLKNPAKWKISTGLWSGAGILILILSVVSIVSFWQMNSADDNLDEIVNRQIPLENAVREMEVSLTGINSVITGDSFDANRIVQYEAEFETSLDRFVELVDTDDLNVAAQQIENKYSSLVSENREIIISNNQLSAYLESLLNDIEDVKHSIDNRLITQIEAEDPEAAKKISASYGMKNALISLSIEIRNHVMFRDFGSIEEVFGIQEEFDSNMIAFQDTDLSVLEESWLGVIKDDYEKVGSQVDGLIELADELNGRQSAGEKLTNDMLAVLTNDVQPVITSETNEIYDKSTDALVTTRIWILAIGILGLVLGGGLTILVARRIVRSIHGLQEGANAVADGKIQHRFYIDTGDEFGKIAMTLNQMLENIGRSREALGESEETAWQLLDSATDSVFLMDLRGTIVASNEVAAERYGKSLEQMIDASYYDLLPADLMVTRKAQIAEVIKTAKPYHLEDDREGMVLDTRIFPVINPDNGRVVRIAIFSRDITTRKWVEEVTESLGKRNELILEAAGEGIYGLDTQGRTTFVNPAAARMLGYKLGDLIGQYHHELVHHSRANGMPYPADQCPIHAAFSDGVARTNVDDEVFWRKDGTCFAVEYTSTPILENGKVVGAVVTFRDITERKQMEAALKRSDERYRSIFESNATLIVSVDSRGFVIDCNARVQGMLGYLPEEIIGKKLTEIVHQDDCTNVEKELGDVLIYGYAYDKQRKLLKKGGTEIDVNVDYASLKDDKGQYVRTICMMEDVTEKVQR